MTAIIAATVTAGVIINTVFNKTMKSMTNNDGDEHDKINSRTTVSKKHGKNV